MGLLLIFLECDDVREFETYGYCRIPWILSVIEIILYEVFVSRLSFIHYQNDNFSYTVRQL